MEELLEYRQRMVNKFAESGKLLETALLLINDPTQPLEPGGWNPHQVVAHMRDVNRQVYIPRLHRIVEEENPLFEDFDGETWMTLHYQPREAMQELITEFGEQCLTNATWLRSLPIETWNRSGKHPTIGVHSLQWWVERLLAHISDHLLQLGQKGD
jgi:hypothetical protein